MKSKNLFRIILVITVFLLLYLAQILLGKTGHYVATFIPYQTIDPYNCFAEVSFHHAVELVIGLLLILVLSKWFKLDFCFQPGDRKKGVKYLLVFTVVMAIIAIAQNMMFVLSGQIPEYAFPLDARNIIGTLSFQLFLSGPAEEVIFRALPITMLVFTLGKSVKIKNGFTLEILLSSLLFAAAHMKLTIFPLSIKADYFQLLYAFVLGSVQGIVYQKTRSLLYPILMHSFSNVLMVGIGYGFALLF